MNLLGALLVLTLEEGMVGPRLEVALAELRARGLRLVYTSDLVRPDMKVKTAPRATSPREMLDELLAPHGLEARSGPGGTLLVVKARGGQRGAGAAARFQDTVTVQADRALKPPGPEPLALRPAEVMATAGAAESVFRVAQTLPGVAALNEFDGRMAVRGGGPDQNLTILDGVEIHNPFRLGGLVSAFNPETVERFELSTGAFDVRHGDRLSSLLVVESRQGSRAEAFQGLAAIGTSEGIVLLEGGLPANGSWLVTGRRTYHDAIGERFVDSKLPSLGDVQGRISWEPRPGRRLTAFGLCATEALGLRELNSEGEDYVIAGDGKNALAAIRFDAGRGRSTALRTIASFTRFQERIDYHGTVESDGRRAASGPEEDSRLAEVLFYRRIEVRDLALRQELSLAGGERNLFETGLEAHVLDTNGSWRTGGDRSDGLTNGSRVPYPHGLPGRGLPSALDSGQRSFRGAAWVQDRVQLSPPFALQPGLRLDWSSVNREATLSPRLAATLRLGPSTRLRAAAGLHYQSPGPEKVFQGDYFIDLTQARPLGIRGERSVQFVLGLERDLGAGVLARAEGFHKSFSGLVVGRLETEAERQARLATYDVAQFPSPSEVPAAPQITSIPSNGASGRAYGFELYLARPPVSTETRLHGWLSYGYGVADREAYGRSYPFDYDRRHAASVVAGWRPFAWFEVAATFRVQSGFPYTPALGVRVAATGDSGDADGDGDRLELVPDRDAQGRLIYTHDFGDVSNLNQARLPLFARLDTRLTFRPGGPRGRWTIYLDAINVLHRDNAGAITSAVTRAPDGGRPGIEEEGDLSLPFLPSLGVRFRF